MERDFKGVWITKEIWLSKEVSAMEKFFLIEIDSLSGLENGCYASNAHFAELFDLSKNRCSEIIKKLQDKGYITIKLIREGKQIKKRLIFITNKMSDLFGKSNTPIRKIDQTYSENRKGNNTNKNNTNNNAQNSAFDEFWGKWPKKVDKKRAFTAWKNLSAKKQKLAIDSIDEFIQGKEFQFIPYPATYLNKERWDDVIYETNQQSNKPTAYQKLEAANKRAEAYINGSENEEGFYEIVDDSSITLSAAEFHRQDGGI